MHAGLVEYDSAEAAVYDYRHISRRAIHSVKHCNGSPGGGTSVLFGVYQLISLKAHAEGRYLLPGLEFHAVACHRRKGETGARTPVLRPYSLGVADQYLFIRIHICGADLGYLAGLSLRRVCSKL